VTTLVVDASVLVKTFLREPDSHRAIALLGANSLEGPAAVAVEIASAITRRFRMGGIARAGAETALSEARAYFASQAMLLHSDAQLLPRAEEIALDLKHALRDCLYVALAERVGGELVTADAVLVARAAAHFPFVKPL
jgi:predicted nucleic acid-binding protein